MFELEVDHETFSASELPEEVRARFAESRSSITAFTILPWEEHCTECAMPACYQTCDLYEPRKDGKCRRFHYGFGYVPEVPSILGYVTKVSFKRWGQLLAYAHLNLVPTAQAQRIIRSVASIDRTISVLPDGRISILGRRGVISRLARRGKQRVARATPSSLDAPVDASSFMVEVFNPQPGMVPLSLVIRDAEGPLSEQPFQERLSLAPGFNRVRIPFRRIAPHVDASRTFHVALCPNLLDPADEGLTLYFGLIAFVREAEQAAEVLEPPQTYEPAALPSGQKHVKVVAWDLDNTLWSGILVEDGEDKLSLKPGIPQVIRELDRRGIVNSIVSKNDPDAALSVLERMGLAEYFVFPKISWEPKSQSVAELTAAFNVGADTIAVLDDSPFERSEIATRCPGVRVYPEDDYRRILDLPEFRPPVSEESSRRREFYRAEEGRVSVRSTFQGDYRSFLKHCQIRAEVDRTTSDNVARAHELIQRTNQLNFSGNRYSRSMVAELIRDDRMIPFSIGCQDRFGDYGLVGFCLVDAPSSTVKDLMFSCRVQAKRVEHAFLIALMRYMKARGAEMLQAQYRRTARNAQAARVFEDLGFTLAALDESTALHTFAFDLRGDLPREDVVEIDWRVA